MTSLIAPEKTLTIRAVASARPSITPTVSVLAPSVLTKNTGSRLCTISDERSMLRLTKPSTQTVRGMTWGSEVVDMPPFLFVTGLLVPPVDPLVVTRQVGEFLQYLMAVAIVNAPVHMGPHHSPNRLFCVRNFDDLAGGRLQPEERCGWVGVTPHWSDGCSDVTPIPRRGRRVGRNGGPIGYNADLDPD